MRETVYVIERRPNGMFSPSGVAITPDQVSTNRFGLKATAAKNRSWGLGVLNIGPVVAYSRVSGKGEL